MASTTETKEQLLSFEENAEKKSWNFSVVRNESGNPFGALVNISDATQELREEKKERKFFEMLTQVPVGICILKGEEMLVEMMNENCLQIVGKAEEQMIGKSVFYNLPEIKPVMEPLLLQVLRTGEAYYGREFPVQLNRYGQEETGYFNIAFQLFREDRNDNDTILVVTNEVTELVKAKQELAFSREEFQSMVMQSPIAMSIFRGTDFVIEIANNTMLKNLWRRESKEVIGKKLLEVFPELVGQKFPALLNNVLATGKSHKENESLAYVDAADGRRKYYLDFEYAPLFGTDNTVSGIMVTVNDVTEKVEVRERIKENEERLNIAIDAADLGTWEVDLKTDLVIYSKKYLEIFGYGADEKPSHDDFLAHLLPADRPLRDYALQQALQSGTLDYEARIKVNGNVLWFKAKGKVFYDEENNPIKLMGTLMDITEQKTAFKALQESEEQFKIIANTAPVMIWMSGNDKFSDFFNNSWLNFTGNEIEDEKGDGWLRGVHPADLEYCVESYKSAYENQEKFYTEYRLLRYDGHYRWIADNAVPRYDSRGNFVGFISACMDIDDEKKFSETLQESETRFRLLADFMPQFIWTADPSGRLNYFNQEVYHYSGLTFEQLQNDGWLKIVHPDEREENIRRLTHSMRTGEDFNMEHRFRRNDGEYRWQLSRALPQRDINGDIQLWVGTSTDIHEMKELEQQKDYFISMASHELKTPITSMKGYVQMLLSVYENSPEDFLKTSLTKVDKQIGTLTSLISDLLDLSKIKAGTLQLSKEHFKLNEMTREVIEEIKLTEPDYLINFEEGEDLLIYADKNRIGQVLINFLNNAIKYSPYSKTINISNHTSADEISVTVEDKGIGINKEDHEKIFQRFYRVARQNEKTYPGFGIGLFISAEIIHRHKGKIGVNSEPGKGSVFYFSIPLKGE
jgi:PAS domain S-box-containing protein